ncbi:hypothetical protein Cni_G19998 [Canna indica]|uniref:Uncharacterized protein n=1 Tax=Canna indica TaxID=4628 RepID=A0AAQ3QJ20_9LILI|nr:hypothetical protein Cni_G19998 [Canna indica]
MTQEKDFDALGGGGETKEPRESLVGAPPANDPDLPPESILVRVGSGGDLFWSDVVYERDDSTKGNTNPKAQAQQQHAKPRSNSQRFSGSLQPKTPIIGIPAKIQHHSGYLGRSGRRPTNSRIFPKKPSRPDGGGRKSAVPDEEPGSPKVSCIGKVLSERERDRCRSRRQSRPLPDVGKEERLESAGCWSSLSAVFCCGGGNRLVGSASTETSPSVAPAKKAVERRAMAEPDMDPPALGAMRRFASGRRPTSWGGDGDGDMELEAAAWGGRLSVGSLEEAERERQTDGSASV